MRTIQKLCIQPLYDEANDCVGHWARGHFDRSDFADAVDAYERGDGYEPSDRSYEGTRPSHVKHGWALVETAEDGEIDWRECSELEPGAIAVTHNLWWTK
jgi:hypothetical protein